MLVVLILCVCVVLFCVGFGCGLLTCVVLDGWCLLVVLMYDSCVCYGSCCLGLLVRSAACVDVGCC